DAQDGPVALLEVQGDVDLFRLLTGVDLEVAGIHAIDGGDLARLALHPDGAVPGELVAGEDELVPGHQVPGQALAAPFHRVDIPGPLQQLEVPLRVGLVPVEQMDGDRLPHHRGVGHGGTRVPLLPQERDTTDQNGGDSNQQGLAEFYPSHGV